MKKSDFTKEEWEQHTKDAAKKGLTAKEYLTELNRAVRDLDDMLLEAQFGDTHDCYGNRYVLDINDCAGHRG